MSSDFHCKCVSSGKDSCKAHRSVCAVGVPLFRNWREHACYLLADRGMCGSDAFYEGDLFF